MQKKESSKNGIRKTLRKGAVANGIMEGLKQSLAHAQGDITLSSRVYDVAPQVDVKAIRTKLKLSQSEFAARFYFPIRTLQDWELGRNQPLSPIRAYLAVIDKNPQLVEKALRGARPLRGAA